jgi:hypothetical protein
MPLMDTTTEAFALLETGLRRRWLGLDPLAILIAGLESLGTLLVFALLRLVIDPSAIGKMPILGGLRSIFTSQSDTRLLVNFAFLVAISYVVKNGIRFLETYFRQNCVASWRTPQGAMTSSTSAPG